MGRACGMGGKEESFMWDLVRKGHLKDLGTDESLHRMRYGCVDWINLAQDRDQ
jgi:hypothetical protein